MAGLFPCRSEEFVDFGLHCNGRFALPTNCDGLKRLILQLVENVVTKGLLGESSDVGRARKSVVTSKDQAIPEQDE